MKYQQLKSLKLGVLSVGLLLVMNSCGSDNNQSDLDVIGGELVAHGDPLVDSVVMLQISIGREATAADFMNSLLFNQALPKKSSGRCTGTVVKNKHGKKKWHVVTAAHCLQGDVTSVKIYKGSQAFSKFPNPTSKKEAQELSEKIAKIVEESGEQITMQQLGFELIGETATYVNHADFNDRKLTARNAYAKLSSQLGQMSKIKSQFETYSWIEIGVLADLENDNTAFYDSLKSNYDIMLYGALIRNSNSKIEAVEQLHARTLANLDRLNAALNELTPQAEKLSQEVEILKNHADDDIAILTVDGALPKTVTALELTDAAFAKGEEVALLGYGVSILTLDQTEWASPLHPEQIKTTQDLKVINLTVTDANAAAKEATFEDKEGGLCVGDSGGPALVKKNDTYVLAGVNTQANCHNYSKVTMVAKYTDWLHSHM